MSEGSLCSIQLVKQMFQLNSCFIIYEATEIVWNYTNTYMYPQLDNFIPSTLCWKVSLFFLEFVVQIFAIFIGNVHPASAPHVIY